MENSHLEFFKIFDFLIFSFFGIFWKA